MADVSQPLYEIDFASVLGQGTYGAVFAARHAHSGEELAAKVTDLRLVSHSALANEVSIMRSLPLHPNVLGVVATEVVQSYSVRILMERCECDLLTHLMRANGVDERENVRFFNEMAAALTHLHHHGVAHRDVKLENVLIDRDGHLKLCDFGLAVVTHLHDPASGGWVAQHHTAQCGSMAYAAPEVQAGTPYDGQLADAWSLGICLFTMLAGFFPFGKATDADAHFVAARAAVAAGSNLVRFLFEQTNKPCPLGAAACQLVGQLLTVDPARRISAEASLASPWARGASLVAAAPADTAAVATGAAAAAVDGAAQADSRGAELAALAEAAAAAGGDGGAARCCVLDGCGVAPLSFGSSTPSYLVGLDELGELSPHEVSLHFG